MKTTTWIAIGLLGLICWSGAQGQLPAPQGKFPPRQRPGALAEVNSQLQGHVLDYTDNHGADNRIYSPALGEKRDLYVYVPPGFDPHKRYPLMLWLHAINQDELSFLEEVIGPVDRAITSGQLPPMIVASPDGSLLGRPTLFLPGSFFLNTKAGNFEDYLVIDVWNFLTRHFPILPEREAHVVLGGSMGGGSAYHTAIKYPDRFKVVAGIFPPLNLRWEDCHGRYRSPFDPCCWGWRTYFGNKREVLARIKGIFVIRQGALLEPLYGRDNPHVAELISKDNPIEMLDAYDVRPGQFAMYIVYVGQDEFNINTQVESFLYKARQRGLPITVVYDPEGHHNRRTARTFLPGIIEWIGQQLDCYKYLAQP